MVLDKILTQQLLVLQLNDDISPANLIKPNSPINREKTDNAHDNPAQDRNLHMSNNPNSHDPNVNRPGLNNLNNHNLDPLLFNDQPPFLSDNFNTLQQSSHQQQPPRAGKS